MGEIVYFCGVVLMFMIMLDRLFNLKIVENIPGTGAVSKEKTAPLLFVNVAKTAYLSVANTSKKSDGKDNI